MRDVGINTCCFDVHRRKIRSEYTRTKLLFLMQNNCKYLDSLKCFLILQTFVRFVENISIRFRLIKCATNCYIETSKGVALHVIYYHIISNLFYNIRTRRLAITKHRINFSVFLTIKVLPALAKCK